MNILKELASDYRKAKNGMFSQRENMDAVLTWVEQALPEGPQRVAAVTAVMITYNTLLEQVACQLEQEVQEDE